MPELVRKIQLPDGELFPVLIEPRSAPVLEPIRYAVAMLRNAGRAEPTIDAHMRAIAVAREWARSNGFTLESRMSIGTGLDLREIESLSHALRAAQPLSFSQHPLSGNVHRLSRSGKAVKPPLAQGRRCDAGPADRRQPRPVRCRVSGLAGKAQPCRGRAAGASRHRPGAERACQGPRPSALRAQEGPVGAAARPPFCGRRSGFGGQPVPQSGGAPSESGDRVLPGRNRHAPGRAVRVEDHGHRLRQADDLDPPPSARPPTACCRTVWPIRAGNGR